MLSTIRPHRSTTSIQSSAGEWSVSLHCIAFCLVRPASHTYESHPCLSPSQSTSLPVSDAEKASVASRLQHDCMLPCFGQHLYAKGLHKPYQLAFQYYIFSNHCLPARRQRSFHSSRERHIKAQECQFSLQGSQELLGRAIQWTRAGLFPNCDLCIQKWSGQ